MRNDMRHPVFIHRITKSTLLVNFSQIIIYGNYRGVVFQNPLVILHPLICNNHILWHVVWVYPIQSWNPNFSYTTRFCASEFWSCRSVSGFRSIQVTEEFSKRVGKTLQDLKRGVKRGVFKKKNLKKVMIWGLGV